MAYTHINFKTKKELKAAVLSGKTVTCYQPSPWGNAAVNDGNTVIEGPHYPEPHRWYAKVQVKNGNIVKVIS
jgi:hypothetical protein